MPTNMFFNNTSRIARNNTIGQSELFRHNTACANHTTIRYNRMLEHQYILADPYMITYCNGLRTIHKPPPLLVNNCMIVCTSQFYACRKHTIIANRYMCIIFQQKASCSI